MKNNTKNVNKTPLFTFVRTRARYTIVCAFSLALLPQTTVSAVAGILSDSEIQEELNNNKSFEPSEDPKYLLQGAPYIAAIAPTSMSMESLYQRLDKPSQRYASCRGIEKEPVEYEQILTPTLKRRRIDNASNLVEFATVGGRTYTLQYTDETGTDGVRTWFTVATPITPAGIYVSWVDRGPPQTHTRPQSLGRSYRMRLEPVDNPNCFMSLTFPEETKYVGAIWVQSRIIRNQIRNQLGRHLINPENPAYESEAAQLNTLYNNALTYINSKSGNVAWGDALNLDQDNTGLVNDMAWPEFREINGEQVLVPVVYLSANTIAAQRVDSNVTELNSTVLLDALTIEEVTIQFGRNAFLQVNNDLMNNQGEISGDGALQIVAGGNITNLSGLITAQNDLQISAHSITNRTILHRYDVYDRNNRYRLGFAHGYREIASINSSDGSVVLRSDGDIVFQGSQASAEDELTLAANGSIYLGSQLLQSESTIRKHGLPTSVSSIKYLQSSLSATDTIQLIANGHIVIRNVSTSLRQSLFEFSVAPPLATARLVFDVRPRVLGC